MTLRQSSNEIANFHAGKIAADTFNGGGHRDTSGWTSTEAFPQQVKKVLEAIGERNEKNSFEAEKFSFTEKQNSELKSLKSFKSWEEIEDFISKTYIALMKS